MSIVIDLARHRTAPSLLADAGQPSPQPREPLQHFADANNALSMAQRYLRHDNLSAARRKAIQALAALRALDQAQEVQP